MRLLLLTAVLTLGHRASAKDIALTFTSEPSGATVTWNGRIVGTTPYAAKFPGGYFHQTQWITSKVLRTAVTVVLSLPGYEPQQLDLTDGPYERRNLNGQYFGQFWIITGTTFHRTLQPDRQSEVGSAIARIRGGQYLPVPPSAPNTAGLPGSGGRLSIQNTTAYAIRVYFRGPLSRSVTIQAYGSAAVQLLPGVYEEAAETVGSAVTPFYGQHIQEAATSYRVSFVVAAGR